MLRPRKAICHVGSPRLATARQALKYAITHCRAAEALQKADQEAAANHQWLEEQVQGVNQRIEAAAAAEAEARAFARGSRVAADEREETLAARAEHLREAESNLVSSCICSAPLLE